MKIIPLYLLFWFFFVFFLVLLLLYCHHIHHCPDPATWFPHYFCPRVAQWRSTLRRNCHSSANTKTNGLEERSWQPHVEALCWKAKPQHFTCTKIKNLLHQKVGKRKSIDEIVRKSRLKLFCQKVQTHYASKQMNVGNTCFLYHAACWNRIYNTHEIISRGVRLMYLPPPCFRTH